MNEQGLRRTGAGLREALATGRVSLVLGAGGPVGHAFHAGVLAALEETLGWDPRGAEIILGTSAGSQVAALLRAGMPSHDLVARITGDPLSLEGQVVAPHFVRPALPNRPAWWGAPASPRLLRSATLSPWRHGIGAWVAAALPLGAVSLEAQASGIRRMFASNWPAAATWIPALDLDSGEVVTFGRDRVPDVDIGTAVAASCAVPGICRPIVAGNRRYVDAGVVSSHHLHALGGSQQVVIVSSPLSSLRWVRRQIERHVRHWREGGAVVLAFEPRGELRRAMGLDFLDAARAPRIARLAYDLTRGQLSKREP